MATRDDFLGFMLDILTFCKINNASVTLKIKVLRTNPSSIIMSQVEQACRKNLLKSAWPQGILVIFYEI